MVGKGSVIGRLQFHYVAKDEAGDLYKTSSVNRMRQSW